MKDIFRLPCERTATNFESPSQVSGLILGITCRALRSPLTANSKQKRQEEHEVSPHP